MISLDKLSEKKIQDVIVRNLKKLNCVVSIGVSNRHVHLCRSDLEKLFGKGYELTVKKMLSQPGEFACNESVTVMGPNGIIENVRILGPLREHTQIEILQSDLFKLGIQAGIRLSGDLTNTPGAILKYKSNVIGLQQGVIVAKRHIHIDEEQAQRLNLRDRQDVSVEVSGDRNTVFKNVTVRVKKGSFFEMHVDRDEANACSVGDDSKGYLLFS
jgi:putative phosphotransacetylase